MKLTMICMMVAQFMLQFEHLILQDIIYENNNYKNQIVSIKFRVLKRYINDLTGGAFRGPKVNVINKNNAINACSIL